MSEGTVHPLAQPVGRMHAAGAFDWRRLKNSPAKPVVKSSKIF